MSTPVQPDVILGLSPSLYLAYGIYKRQQRSIGQDPGIGSLSLSSSATDPIASACARCPRRAANSGDPQASQQALFRRKVERWLAYPYGGDALTELLWQTSGAQQPLERQRDARCKAEMVNTLTSLRKHSQPLEAYLGDISPVKVYSQLRTDASFRSAIDCATINPKATFPPHPRGSHTTIRRLQALVSWFKHDYMKWIDPIPCPSCSGPTEGEGGGTPTAVDLADGGNRVELHRCKDTACGSARRFVRYTKVSKLLQTKEGRCGEFTHLFYAIIRVLAHLRVEGWVGVETRYVWNKEDHVWVEVWSVEERRWVHVDPCEAAVDSPLLYADGWGKKMSICLAIGPCGAEDVTKSYVSDMPACTDRRKATGWNEKDLALAILQMTIAIRLPMSDTERRRLGTMDRDHAAHAADPERAVNKAGEDHLEGRQSGTEEWRAARGENSDGGK